VTTRINLRSPSTGAPRRLGITAFSAEDAAPETCLS
jgi:hypothetical protein